MFENSLIDLEEKKHPRRWGPLPVAIGLHVVVLVAMVLVQLWSVPAVADPEMAMRPLGPDPIMVTLGPPPPPPPAGPTRPTTPTPTPTTPVQPDTQNIPDTLPDPEPEAATTSTSPFGSPNGVDGGIDGGVDNGDPNSRSFGGGGIGGSVPFAPPEPRNEIVRYDGSMTRPVQLSGRQPRYTELARRAGIQGVVILEAVIDKQGRVSNVRILKSLHSTLDEEALAAVKGWVFEPARQGDRPVAVYYTLTINFQIQR